MAIRPSVSSVGYGDTVTFVGSGGVSPHTFSLEHSGLGEIVAETGVFIAGNSDTDGIVWVTDGSGTSAGALVYVNGSSGEALSLSLQQEEIDRNQAVGLYPSGGTPPYSLSIPSTPLDGNSHTDIYPATPTEGQRGSIQNNNTYNPGDYIGTVWVRVTDSKGAVAERAIKVIAEPPTGFSVTGKNNPNNHIEISWTYSAQSPGIVEFHIQKSLYGDTFGDFIAIPFETNGDSYILLDSSNVQPNKAYWYKVDAISGDDAYDSIEVGPELGVVLN